MPYWDSEDPYFGIIQTDSWEELEQAVTKMVKWNRFDLLKRMNDFIRREGGCKIARTTSSGDVPAIGRLDSLRIPSPGGQIHVFNPATFPEPKGMTVHRHSAASFLKGRAGHSYSGVVQIKSWEGGDRLPKIFLFPLNPTILQDGAPPSKRGGLDFPESVKTRVYSKQHEGTIVHGGRGSDSTSHWQLVRKMAEAEKKQAGPEAGRFRRKLDAASPEEREETLTAMNKGQSFVGFTVHKGNYGLGIPNRFRLVSAGLNGKAFPIRISEEDAWNSAAQRYGEDRVKAEYPAKTAPARNAKDTATIRTPQSQVLTDLQYTMPETWALTIQSAVDGLLRFEHALYSKFGGDYIDIVDWLDSNGEPAKKYWSRLKETVFWTEAAFDLPTNQELGMS